MFEPPEYEQHVGGDRAKQITCFYVIVSAFQSWPLPVCSQAAHYGCGCWAENACNTNPYSTAVSTSGIPRTLFNSRPVASLSAQRGVPFFPVHDSQIAQIAPLLALIKGASNSLRILSDGQLFLPSDSHHSFPRPVDSWVSGLC